MTAVGVVVLHYRNWPEVAACIESVLAQGVPASSVLVVDNASGDGSAVELARAFPTVSLLVLGENGGYAAGMNAGVAQLRDVDVALLLTHDCVLAEGALDALVDAIATDARIGAVGPLLALRSDPGRVFSAGGTFYGSRLATGHTGAGDPVDQWLGVPPHDAKFLDGSCLLVRTAMLRELGGFDEGYFMYFEETDLACRAAGLGWRIVCACDALAFQEPGVRPEALWIRNRLRFLRRNAGMTAALRQGVFDVGSVVRRMLSADPQVRTSSFLRLTGLLAPLTRTSPQRLSKLG